MLEVELTGQHGRVVTSISKTKRDRAMVTKVIFDTELGPGADPGVQAVSLQVTVNHPPAVGCYYLPPGLQLPPQPQSITALWLVPSYTAW